MGNRFYRLSKFERDGVLDRSMFRLFMPPGDVIVCDKLAGFRSALAYNNACREEIGYYTTNLFENQVYPYISQLGSFVDAIERGDDDTVLLIYAEALCDYVADGLDQDVFFSPREHLDGVPAGRYSL